MAETVHVVDDDPAVRDSLQVLLESFGFAVCTYDRAEALLSVACDIDGCVLTDVRMPEIDGLEMQRRLADCRLRLPVIVMTGEADVPMAVRAMRAGAVDFLEKPFDDSQLVDAIYRALKESRRRQQSDVTAVAAVSKLAALTPREREVFDLLVQGLSNKEIANRLGASPRTIEVHRARVFNKLQAHSLPDLVRLALAADLIESRRTDTNRPNC